MPKHLWDTCTNCIHVNDCDIQLRIEEHGLDLMVCIEISRGRAGRRHIVTQLDGVKADNCDAWVKEHGECNKEDNRCATCGACSPSGACLIAAKTCWDLVARHSKTVP